MSSTRPDTVCFDDVVVYEKLSTSIQDLILEIELVGVQWANGWLATPTKHTLGTLKLDVDQAVSLHRNLNYFQYAFNSHIDTRTKRKLVSRRL